jgi:hypothetical protein
MITDNILQLPDSRAYEKPGTFDPHSIMAYHMPAWLYKEGSSSPCYNDTSATLTG